MKNGFYMIFVRFVELLNNYLNGIWINWINLATSGSFVIMLSLAKTTAYSFIACHRVNGRNLARNRFLKTPCCETDWTWYFPDSRSCSSRPWSSSTAASVTSETQPKHANDIWISPSSNVDYSYGHEIV